ncbi:class A beta-lactamase-related serine hydrolase [Gammaproteobacteria bacterium LSUCC0112]|nr:class A beta-lactamase-related serine hydrolase [Gammaproteobacteria bacterium LSUCC0112]
MHSKIKAGETAMRTNTLRQLTTAILIGSGLLFSAGLATAQHDNSIKMIDASALGITSAEIASIKAQMQAAVDGGHIAGALLLAGNKDGIAMLETAGTQGPGDATPVDQETIFRIYSMTKPIVSVAAMDMVEDGLLSVSDPVSKYIPEFSNMQVVNRETGALSPAQNVMTVEHLLTHKSGLIQAIFSPDTDLGKAYAAQIPGDGSLTNLEVAQRIGKLPLFFEPGTAWHYGHSTDVLGAVLEVAAGQPLETILNERIFEPLGMDETTFYVPASKASRLAQPIHGEMADNTVVRPQQSGGGGLNSTTEDYVRFAQMLLQGGEYRGARILEPETLALMQEKRITPDVSRQFFFYGNRGDWSMGFHLQPVDASNPDGAHNFGWRGIGGTLFLVDPENEFFMIYMEQKRGGPRGAPFDNNVAQRVVYEAVLN